MGTGKSAQKIGTRHSHPLNMDLLYAITYAQTVHIRDLKRRGETLFFTVRNIGSVLVVLPGYPFEFRESNTSHRYLTRKKKKRGTCLDESKSNTTGTNACPQDSPQIRASGKTLQKYVRVYVLSFFPSPSLGFPSYALK